jgi:hypothetical protein
VHLHTPGTGDEGASDAAVSSSAGAFAGSCARALWTTSKAIRISKMSQVSPSSPAPKYHVGAIRSIYMYMSRPSMVNGMFTGS